MFNQNCEISLSQCPSQPLAATGCANLVGYGDISIEGGEGRERERKGGPDGKEEREEEGREIGREGKERGRKYFNQTVGFEWQQSRP